MTVTAATAHREQMIGPEDRHVMAEIRRLPELAADDRDLARRGRFLDVECLVGSFAAPLHLTIAQGRIVDVAAGPTLMRSWRFAFRATPEAWIEHWQPLPRPGFHDLLALTKRGAATLEGDLQPFLANLQYFKDLLALPRVILSGGAS